VPTYQYHCKDCATDLEVVQKMTDPSLTVCPRCEGTLRKVFSPVGVVFKGSGFYATDNRTRRTDSPKPEAKPDTAKPDAKPQADAKPKTETKTPALASA